MKTITLLLLSVGIAFGLSAQTWNNTFISAGTGEKPKLAESPNGTIYLAYRDFQTGKANVKQHSNNTWSWVGDSIFSPAGISKIKLAVGADNLPVVAFQDMGKNAQLTVMKFNGTQWDTLGNRGFSGFTGAGDIGLAIKGNRIFAAYQQYNQIKVWYWDNFQGLWSFVGNGGQASLGFPGGCDLRVIGDNLYVAYRDNSDRNIVRYTNANTPSAGSAWITLGGMFNSGVRSAIRITPVLGRVFVTNIRSSNDKIDCDMYIQPGNLWFNGGSTVEPIQVNYYDVSSNNIDSIAYLAYVDPDDSARIYSANINLTWSRLGNGLFTNEAITGEVATLYTSDKKLFTAYQTKTGSKIKVNQFCSAVSNPTFSLLGDTVFCGDTNVRLVATTAGSTYQWYKDGAMISGASSASLNISESGSYYYKLSNTCGETDSSLAINLTKEPVPTPSITENNGVLETQVFGLYQWRKSGVEIPGAQSQTYTPTESGLYSVVVTNNQILCLGFSADYSFTKAGGPSGLTSAIEDNPIAIFPNPSNGKFRISGLQEAHSVSVFDVNGQKVELRSNARTMDELNMSDQPKGVYFLKVIDLNGKTSFHKIILR